MKLIEPHCSQVVVPGVVPVAAPGVGVVGTVLSDCPCTVVADLNTVAVVKHLPFLKEKNMKLK